MIEKVRYQVRARALIDMVNALKTKSLILSPHFQRKLVWREIHKIDFIKTILLGYPFPEIFIARGGIDVENMTSVSCVVDGQQRMNSILEYVSDKFSVDGKKYSELSSGEKEEILKYEIAVIELDLDQNSPQVINIFKRLNRTFYSLSQIEKLSTEYASSGFMLIAKLLCGEFIKFDEELDVIQNVFSVNPEIAESDPNITAEFVQWGNGLTINSAIQFLVNSQIFSPYEISRQVHLMYTLNLLATLISGYYARNERVIEHLEKYTDSFEGKDDLILRINNAADKILHMNLEKDFWFSKSNSFTLLLALDEKRNVWENIGFDILEQKLNEFASNPGADYALAAKEAVNNKKERLLRHGKIIDIINQTVQRTPNLENALAE